MDNFSVIRRRSDKSDGSERYDLLGCHDSMPSAERSLENLSDIQKDDIIIVCDTAEICDYYNHKNIYIVSDNGAVGRCRSVTKGGIVGEWEGPSSRAETMLVIAIGAEVGKKYIIFACLDIFDLAVKKGMSSGVKEIKNILHSARMVALLKSRGKTSQYDEDILSQLETHMYDFTSHMDYNYTIEAAICLFGVAENMNTHDCVRLVSLACYITGMTPEDLSDVVRKHIPLRMVLAAILNKYKPAR